MGNPSLRLSKVLYQDWSGSKFIWHTDGNPKSFFEKKKILTISRWEISLKIYPVCLNTNHNSRKHLSSWIYQCQTKKKSHFSEFCQEISKLGTTFHHLWKSGDISKNSVTTTDNDFERKKERTCRMNFIRGTLVRVLDPICAFSVLIIICSGCI